MRENYGPVTVPPNQYFVMGDNRDNSAGQPVLGVPAARLHQRARRSSSTGRTNRSARTTKTSRPARRSRDWCRSSCTSSRRRDGTGCCTRFTDARDDQDHRQAGHRGAARQRDLGASGHLTSRSTGSRTPSTNWRCTARERRRRDERQGSGSGGVVRGAARRRRALGSTRRASPDHRRWRTREACCWHPASMSAWPFTLHVDEPDDHVPSSPAI